MERASLGPTGTGNQVAFPLNELVPQKVFTKSFCKSLFPHNLQDNFINTFCEIRTLFRLFQATGTGSRPGNKVMKVLVLRENGVLLQPEPRNYTVLSLKKTA